MHETTIRGVQVVTQDTPGAPLLVTLRMAPLGMNLWSRVWPSLARDFSLASFNLPVPDPADFDSPRRMFADMARQCVEIADALGHDRFHFIGWTGGATLGMHLLVDAPDHLASCVLFGAHFPFADDRWTTQQLRLLDHIVRDGGLELWTWYWMQMSFTPGFLERNFTEIEQLVSRRLHADRARGLDADRVMRWIEVLRRPQLSDLELGGVTTPTLVAATATDIDAGRRLQRKIPTAELTFVNGGAFAPYELPDVWMAAVSPFLRAVRHDPTAATKRPSVVRPARVAGQLPGDDTVGVVFLHGLLMSPDIWDPQVDILRDRGIRAVATVQPGHSAEAGPDTDVTLGGWAEQLQHKLDDLGLERVVLIGHSMGGMLALEFLRRWPERVIGLGLVSTTDEPWDADHQDSMVSLVNGLAVGWGTDLARVVAERLVGAAFLERSPAFVGTWANQVASFDLPSIAKLGPAVAFREDQTPVTAEASVPVMIVHGTDDLAVEYERGVRMTQRCKDANFFEIPGGGHCPPLEAPQVVTAAVLDLLDRSDVARRTAPGRPDQGRQRG